jgi:hypothetical protein
MDLKELGKLIDLCRRKGVSDIAMEGVSLKLLPEAPPSSYKKKKELTDQPEDVEDPWRNFPQGDLTMEQMAFYSAGGLPENDPENDL